MGYEEEFFVAAAKQLVISVAMQTVANDSATKADTKVIPACQKGLSSTASFDSLSGTFYIRLLEDTRRVQYPVRID